MEDLFYEKEGIENHLSHLMKHPNNVNEFLNDPVHKSLLSNHHIPFRYEGALHLGSLTLYPDFTILHLATEKVYYFEHFGMMDEQGYRLNTSKKLQTYINHGIIPTIDLITTYETKDHPISARTIEKIIQDYFL